MRIVASGPSPRIATVLGSPPVKGMRRAPRVKLENWPATRKTVVQDPPMARNLVGNNSEPNAPSVGHEPKSPTNVSARVTNSQKGPRARKKKLKPATSWRNANVHPTFFRP